VSEERKSVTSLGKRDFNGKTKRGGIFISENCKTKGNERALRESKKEKCSLESKGLWMGGVGNELATNKWKGKGS